MYDEFSDFTEFNESTGQAPSIKWLGNVLHGILRWLSKKGRHHEVLPLAHDTSDSAVGR